MLFDDLFENVPDFRPNAFDHSLRTFDVVCERSVNELLHHKRFEQLERHFFGQTALMQLERRADDDDRAARVVNPLTQQVLAESALLTFENVGKRFERTIVRAGNGTPAAAVIDQRVHRFLEHALFVLDDDFGRVEFQQPFEPVVPVDDAPVEIVEIRSGEATAIQLDHRSQLGRDHRHRGHDHPLRLVAAGKERFDDFEPFDRLKPLLARGLLEFFT